MTTYINVYIPNQDEDDYIEVELYADVRMVNNGIGPYECHGYRGYDRRMEPEVTGEISYHKAMYTNAECEIIDQYIDEHEEQIMAGIIENYEED